MRNKVTTGKVLLISFLSLLVMVSAQGLASLIFVIPIPEAVSSIIVVILYVALAFLGVKILSEKVLHLSLYECRTDKPHIQIKWLICAFVLPITVIVIFLCFPGSFIQNDMDSAHTIKIILTTLFMAGIGPAIVEEMVFRGLIMKAFEKRWGKTVAILVPSVIFGLLHAIGEDLYLIDLLMLFVGGTLVGIMFSLIVYESGSIWNSVFVHGLWNFIVGGGVLHIGTTHSDSSVFSYKLLNNSPLLTGGNLGIDISVFAILGYLVVIVSILLLLNKRRTME